MRLAALAAGTALAGLLAGCASGPSEVLGLDAVANERAARAEARVATLLESYADYLTGRWPGIRLPETSIQAWLEPGVWQATFENCASEASGLTVRVDPTAGVFAMPPAQTAGELRDFETSIYFCQGRFPPTNLAVSDPGPIEIAWMSSYVRDALPTCLRLEGVTAAPMPDDPPAILSGGSTPGWDAYAAARGGAPEVRRLQALCPHPSVLLASLPSLGEAR